MDREPKPIRAAPDEFTPGVTEKIGSYVYLLIPPARATKHAPKGVPQECTPWCLTARPSRASPRGRRLPKRGRGRRSLTRGRRWWRRSS